ncbi:MAG: helix-turn-helix transcriptional regulator [Janthinobacterium lividum]
MFSPLYFPLVAALAARHDTLVERLAEGRIGDALAAAARLLESDSGHANADVIRLGADLRLAVDQTEDAEDGYRKTLRVMRTSHQLRALSCRDTGWLALFRHRAATALNCFARVVAETQIEPDRLREARFAMVVTLGELGRLNEMDDALDALDADVAAAVDADPRWREIVQLLRHDIAVQNHIRQFEPLADHVYWQSLQRDPMRAMDLELETAPTCTLLRARYECLQNLRMLAHGNRDGYLGLDAHLRWAQQEGLTDYQRALRVEIAVAALSGGLSNLAEQILQPVSEQARESGGRRLLEYQYCIAKVRWDQGRTQDWHRLYSRYALLALRAIRDESRVATPYSVREAGRPDAPLDDVAARLPAKYRRAYRYLLANLERRDLSVREVAAEINVTERALQTAFKNFVGLTPTEVIRRRRMESIHAELSNQDHDGGVLDTAHRWGVMHRSTLVNGYRKYFDEVPSETLAR